MKKIFLFAALACIVFASCQKEAPVASVQNDGQQEITFSALSKAMTKGVLGSGTFATNRTIQVAGTMKSGDKYVDFLEAKTFARKGTDGATWQGVKKGTSGWEADPVYYPIGGQNSDFRFLAYSETADANTFARWYGSNEVELQVSDCAENEIVYSGFEGNKTASAGASATFARTQALVTVKILAKSNDHNLIINKIGFKDVKTSGTLLLKYDADATTSYKATAQWLYNAGCNCAFAEMGSKKLNETTEFTVDSDKEVDFITVTATSDADALGYKLTTTGFRLDRLFPAQELQAKTMVINYTLGGNTFDVELDLAEAKTSDASPVSGNVKWEAGKRYVYNITVNVIEILINPTAPDPWTVTTFSGQYDPAS